MNDTFSQLCLNGSGVGIMPVGGHTLGHLTRNGPGGAEEGLGRCTVAPLAQVDIHQIHISIYGEVQVDPPALPFQIRLVAVPAPAHSPAPMFTEGFTTDWGQFGFPLPHGFVSKHQPTVEEHLRKIPETEFVTHPPQYHQTDDIGRILHSIPQCPRLFVEPAPAGTTAKPPIAPSRRGSPFRSGRRITVWTIHLTLPPRGHILLRTTETANWRET